MLAISRQGDPTCPLVLSEFDNKKLYKGSSNFFSQIENFFAPDDSETSEPEESTSKKFFENSNFLLLKNRLLYFSVIFL